MSAELYHPETIPFAPVNAHDLPTHRDQDLRQRVQRLEGEVVSILQADQYSLDFTEGNEVWTQSLQRIERAKMIVDRLKRAITCAVQDDADTGVSQLKFLKEWLEMKEKRNADPA